MHTVNARSDIKVSYAATPLLSFTVHNLMQVVNVTSLQYLLNIALRCVAHSAGGKGGDGGMKSGTATVRAVTRTPAASHAGIYTMQGGTAS